MARSSKKGPYVDAKLLKKLEAVKVSKSKQTIKTYARSSTITPDFIGFTISVHNGKTFIPVRITENMVGHRLGEFAPTRKFIKHGGVKAKKAPAPK